jgi:hypothetical protein
MSKLFTVFVLFNVTIINQIRQFYLAIYEYMNDPLQSTIKDRSILLLDNSELAHFE